MEPPPVPAPAPPRPSPGRLLRDAMTRGAVALPGVFNALTARIAERVGFEAAYFSGGALSAGWAALPDVGLVTLPEFVDEIAVIARATRLPVLCDADTGFGDGLNAARAVELYQRAGAAGLHLEDQTFPKRCGHLAGKSVIPIDEMVAKLRVALQARTDPDFLVVARTDARAVEGFEAAVARARAYREAGADAIFPEALESELEFARFAERVPGPLLANMTEFGKSPALDLATLENLGYRLVIFPLTPFRAAMKTAEDLLVDLKRQGHARNWLDRMQTRARLYDLIDYERWNRGYAGPHAPNPRTQPETETETDPPPQAP